ncbi:MAG: prepilin peptidase [Anaerolineales bacterium]|uniref:prepilin peptidase n=1 Tax=Candidatus Villigracilis affinis TaxID=3140682 RepID=UPI002A235119|nr:prepilin peptidase [Anaerolineales bacterium]MBL0347906.1 prepilin peptidase [Anaerolineales bacterium]
MSFTVIVSILFGWLAGLLINYLADVLPLTRRFSQPACPHCNVSFAWQDYLLFKPCTNGHPRSARPWVVQLVIVVISIYSWLNPPSKIGYALGMILLVYFGIVFVIDLEHRLILHPTSIFGAVFGLIIGTIAHGIGPTLWGGLGGFVIMIALYYFGVLFARIRTRRLIAAGQEPDDEEALGAGDVILITILGFILGWPLIWFGFLLGVLLGGFFSLLIIAWLVIGRQYKQNAMMMFIPYGPYFVASAFLVVFFPKFLAMIVPG